MLDRMMRENAFVGGDVGGGSFGGDFGGSDGGGSIVPVPVRAPARSMGPQITPTAISQPRSTLGTLTGTAAPKGYGVKLLTRFKKGGLAVKPVRGKERPDNLGKLKDLSVKRKKSAKAKGGMVEGYAEGGQSRVNEAGNYTKPGMRKRLFESIKSGGSGGAPGQWSARKAQMLAKRYKESGGGYK